MSPLDLVRGKLEGVKGSDDTFTARCPGHPDTNNSLSVKVGEDGKILLKCHAGCPVESIIAPLGLGLSDLFPKKRKGSSRPSPHRVEQSNGPGLTLEEFALSKGFSLDFLRRHDVSECTYTHAKAVRFEYRDSNGSLLAVRFRVSFSGDRFRWRSGDKVQLYGLSKLNDAKTKGYITICEGESDCLTLWLHGEPALGLPGADTWREAWAEYLADIPLIYVVIEPDLGGETMKKWLSKSVIRDRVRLVSVGGICD